jgi:hypothetical protein
MAESFDGFRKMTHDAEVEAQIVAHCEKFAVSPMDAIRHFSVLARRQPLKRFLAHTDLFKQTLGVPGDIAELGVFRGMGLMTWANLLEAYCIGDRTKTVYGFDNWAGFGEFSPEDGKNEEEFDKIVGGFNPGPYKEELESAIAIFDNDRFIPQKPRIKLIEGNIEESVPLFTEENPGVRFSFVHFDCDLYKPTKAALEALWPKLARGGLMLFDEYGMKEWPGETQAVDEFFSAIPTVRLQTLDWTNVPAAFLIKD